jgi:hypothetical protein
LILEAAHLKKALGGGAACMHHTLRNALAIKVCELLNEMVVLQQNGAALPNGKGGVVIPHWQSLIGGHVH